MIDDNCDNAMSTGNIYEQTNTAREEVEFLFGLYLRTEISAWHK